MWYLNPDPTAVNAPAQDYQPDSTARQVALQRFNVAGQLTEALQAPEVTYYHGLNATHITAPELVLYNPTGLPQWRLTAKEGVFNLEDNVILREQVKVEDLQHSAPLDTLTTSYLEIDLISEKIRSNQMIYLLGPNVTVQGRGLDGDLKQKRVELLEEGYALYRPDL
jgi:lipopolysaccharide export system protein LptC